MRCGRAEHRKRRSEGERREYMEGRRKVWKKSQSKAIKNVTSLRIAKALDIKGKLSPEIGYTCSQKRGASTDITCPENSKLVRSNIKHSQTDAQPGIPSSSRYMRINIPSSSRAASEDDIGCSSVGHDGSCRDGMRKGRCSQSNQSKGGKEWTMMWCSDVI